MLTPPHAPPAKDEVVESIALDLPSIRKYRLAFTRVSAPWNHCTSSLTLMSGWANIIGSRRNFHHCGTHIAVIPGLTKGVIPPRVPRWQPAPAADQCTLFGRGCSVDRGLTHSDVDVPRVGQVFPL